MNKVFSFQSLWIAGMVLLSTSLAIADTRKIDNQQLVMRESILIAEDSLKPAVKIAKGTLTNITYSESSDSDAAVELCFEGPIAPKGPKKGDILKHQPLQQKKSDANSDEDMPSTVIGQALDDLNRFEFVDGLYCVRGILPLASVDLDTLPEHRAFPLLVSQSGFEKFEFLEKEFSYKPFAVGSELRNWKVLEKNIWSAPGAYTKTFIVFHKGIPSAFGMHLSPALVKKASADWNSRSPIVNNLPVFVLKKLRKEVSAELEQVFARLGARG